MKLDSLKPLLSGHYILNPVASLLYVILKCVEPFCGWLFPGEECYLAWVSRTFIARVISILSPRIYRFIDF